uniref:Reverse transcriptase domain-containing protein n=1 Tax=Tanacetum cinerariifolium TaxID=118510 RepID=A0A6L2K0E5_TANCI|nr:reverse transcriptase domain-containing protein [Tanacetum cinerariifolium]
MLIEGIKQSESYQIFIKYSTGLILPKKSIESDSKPARRETGSRRVIKKKVLIFVDDNIIPEPNITLELGKSMSLIEVAEEEAARQVDATHERIATEYDLEPTKRRPSGTVFRDTSSVLKKISPDPSQKLKSRRPGTKLRRKPDELNIITAKVTFTKPKQPMKPNKNLKLRKRFHPSSLAGEVFASAIQQMVGNQKRSSEGQNLSANCINNTQPEQRKHVRPGAIVRMIRGNTNRKRLREQLEPWMDNEISFPSMPGCQLVDSPIILESLIKGFLVWSIYVDGGSSSEIMYEH